MAFLEDLLINHGCLPALANGRSSGQPERCHECACRIEDLVDRIRRLSSAMRRTDN